MGEPIFRECIIGFGMSKYEQNCFVIAPIGPQDSKDRKRSNQVLEHIIKPAAKRCGYRTVRADKILKPGNVLFQIVQRLRDDPLVIADLTGGNPNVFYELAIRHVVGKPVIPIIQVGEPIPFDIVQSRTIQFDYKDVDSVVDCRERLVESIRAVEKEPTNVGMLLGYAWEPGLGNPADARARVRLDHIFMNFSGFPSLSK